VALGSGFIHSLGIRVPGTVVEPTTWGRIKALYRAPAN
jgi:hypothetical protein